MRKTPDTTLKMSRKLLDTTLRLTRGVSDVTSKLPLATPEAAATTEAVANFEWPTPSYYEYAGPRPAAPERCVITFGDDAKAAGTLLYFSPEEQLLRFQQEKAEASISVAFSTLRSLELVRPVGMRRQTLPGTMGERVFAPSDRQPYTVRLQGGKLCQGQTAGVIEALCGLFLFVAADNDAVVRQFIPAQAMQDYSVGKPLGRMLVDGNLATPEVIDKALQQQATLRGRRFGEYLTDSQIVSPEQLAAALKRQRAQPEQRLGETLVELGYLSPSDLADALAIEQRNRSIPLGQILADMGVLDADVINGVMAQKLGIPFVSLKAFDIAPEILKRVSAAAAFRYHMIPLAESDNALVVAVDNPMNMAKMNDLRFIAGSKLIPVMASAEDIRQALRKHYGGSEQAGGGRANRPAERPPSRSLDTEMPVEELTARLAAESGDIDLSEQHAEQDDTTLVKLVNKIILDAIEQNASDIHIEANPGGAGTRIRLRKDGVLVAYLDLPARFRRALVSRVKIMSQLDITERRRPQDGKIDFARFGPLRAELRVATIPTANGLEDVVMRVLSAATPLSIDRLGFDAAVLATLRQLMARPHGLFLVCGPTGSGKTTTLHSLLEHLNTDERKIWTAEDPIEIVQPGLRQVQINAKIGWTFAAAMRSFMRADPDVVMVGEMRDAETAKTGIEASLTGHLVLSTLHTNSAAESVIRLLDLGMDPFNFADALLGVLSQRLVRRLCANCRTAYPASGAELDELAADYCNGSALVVGKLLESWHEQHADKDGRIILHRANGCKLCDSTGYRGRIGVYELLAVGPALKRLIQTRAPVPEITVAALANGMRTLKQDGIARILGGITDIRQVRKI